MPRAARASVPLTEIEHDQTPRIPGGVPGRRTVTIRGQVAPPRRPPRRAHERAGSRPDRIAMWAVLLGLLLVLVAATSSHAAVVHAAVMHVALH